MNPVPVDGKGLDWPRRVANAVNGLLAAFTRRGQYPFEALTSDPGDPSEGRTYLNTATHKLRLYTNGAWFDLN